MNCQNLKYECEKKYELIASKVSQILNDQYRNEITSEKSLEELYGWKDYAVSKIQESFNCGFSSSLRAYRLQDKECLDLELISLTDEKKRYVLIFCACGNRRVINHEEVEVLDLTEALHLTGLILESFEARVKIGIIYTP